MARTDYESDARIERDRYRAAWLDECIALSALCMDLAQCGRGGEPAAGATPPRADATAARKPPAD